MEGNAAAAGAFRTAPAQCPPKTERNGGRQTCFRKAWNAAMKVGVEGLAMRSESNMGNLAWVILAIGASLGGLIMIFGLRKADTRKADARPEASGQIDGALKEDWRRTGNIDFHVSTDDDSSSQPLRLWVEEKRIVESVVGQDVVELRWRLATVEEGKELIVCWNNAKLTLPYDTRRAWQINNERNSPAAAGQAD
jgi:hypothetical protein